MCFSFEPARRPTNEHRGASNTTMTYSRSVFYSAAKVHCTILSIQQNGADHMQLFTLDWGMELVEGDHGLRGQHREHRLPNVFIVEYRCVILMTIHVFLLFASLIQAVMILASPPTGLQASNLTAAPRQFAALLTGRNAL